ncbi:hypothetical protein E2C01_055122 [Portunus trituberculatus]|uniref:Endonuclease/exonuclease/phosphatase domain-containing protein n=1 Tax=Portunus trituberculatus TaxID=210409 RepID=A0A5B7GTZ3_PORTR|nr:hypothetical protein [Portunus trituberculatus]
MEPTYGRIYGFIHWTRRDRQEQAGGGVAVCFKEGMQAQQLNIDIPPLMEVMYFRVMLADRSALLLCALYCPTPPTGLDNLILAHSCSHVLIVGYLNLHLERDAYDNLLEVQGLTDHVTFPTYDYQEDRLQCHQLGLVGSSDHHAVLTQLDVGVARDEATTRTMWMWNKAEWASLLHNLTYYLN